MNENYDVVRIFISCAVPFQNAISILKTDSYHAELIEKFLCKNPRNYNNFLIIENLERGYFYGTKLMCQRFSYHLFAKRNSVINLSANLWTVRFDIDDFVAFINKLGNVFSDNTFKLCNKNISGIRTYNEIFHVCEYMQQDLNKMIVENIHMAKLLHQIMVQAFSVLQLLKGTNFHPKLCTQTALIKLTKESLISLGNTSFYGIEKFERIISYRKLFIPKLLSALKEME